jgi:hypothetical protein
MVNDPISDLEAFSDEEPVASNVLTGSWPQQPAILDSVTANAAIELAVQRAVHQAISVLKSQESPNDTQLHIPHNPSMNNEFPVKIGKKLSAIEKRMDKRIDRMEKSEDRRADAYRREQEARDILYAERYEHVARRLEDRDKVIDSKLDAMSASIVSSNALITAASAKVDGFEAKLTENLKEVKASNKETSRHILGIVIAVLFGFLAVNATMIFGAKSFFDSGKEVAALQSSIEDLKKTMTPPSPPVTMQPQGMQVKPPSGKNVQ